MRCSKLCAAAANFDLVQSKDSWSDGVSRQGVHDQWYQAHEFRVHRVPASCACLTLCKSCCQILLSALGVLSALEPYTLDRYVPGVQVAWATVAGPHQQPKHFQI